MEAVQVEPTTVGRLLIVDDEENILRALRRVLRREPYEIRTAPDAESAAAVLESFAPEVVISDFRLPGMNGVEFLTRVKAQLPASQRILLTGQADQSAIEAAINRSEIFRFIGKPWNDSQLVLTIKSAFEQYEVLAENARLQALTQRHNEELKAINAQLEEKVQQRTLMLSQAKREWEVTFDTLDVPLAVVDKDHRVRRANLAFARAANRAPTELGTRPHCHEWMFGRDATCQGCPLSQAIRTGEPAAAEMVHAERTYALSIFPFDDGERAVCIYHDVTDERALVRRMVETEKMAAVGQLAGGVAHEINNPLGGILAFAQLMRRDAGRTPQDQESLALIEESALRCKRIVQSLLQFARRSRDEDRREFDLSRSIEETVVLFQAQLMSAPKARLEQRLASGLPGLFGNPQQLGQVVLNLLQNALYALGKEGGQITVTTGREDDRLFFRVEDTGSGIAAEHLSRIFEPSFTTKPPGEGTGLGLSIAYRIVQDHGGTIEVKSAPGQGARFTVWLPVHPPELTLSRSSN